MWIAPLFIHKWGVLYPKGEIAERKKNRWKELFILQVSEIRKVKAQSSKELVLVGNLGQVT